MTNPLATAAIEAGLVSQEAMDEMRRWRPPIDLPEKAPAPPDTPQEAAQIIEQVLQSEGLVLTRETDLEVLQQYLTTQRQGTLHIEIAGVTLDEPSRIAEFEVTYGTTLSGEYIFAYRGDTMAEEITNGLSYLAWGDDVVGGKIFFNDAREVFYGEVKAFMVCAAPSKALLNAGKKVSP